MTQTIGLIAGFITSFALLPQVLKVVKSKSTHDISLLYFIFLDTGMAMWLIYGILINDLPLILANILALIFSITITVYKIRFK